MPLQPQGNAPYAPPSAITAIIDAYRDRGLGTPIDAIVLGKVGITDSLTPRTLQGMRLLELMDENGQPLPSLEAFRQARGDDEFQTHGQDWVRAVYADVLQYADPSTDPINRIAEAFRGYTPNGQRPRMAVLLNGLWQYVGFSVPDSEATPRKPRTPRTAPSRKDSPPAPRPKPTVVKGAPELSASGLPPGLVGLLRQIPTDGGSWTKARRDEFLTAFTAVLDFSVAIGVNDAIGITDDAGVSTS